MLAGTLPRDFTALDKLLNFVASVLSEVRNIDEV